ncbi:MAG: hypothetical protein ACD_81C00218G0011 [uncultured bacterium]|uniref:Uncharacterized protein n=2 Tax=Candidatus Wolfeibacteriota TaxID=1752735 RepID=A0A0G1JI97_9BACT|nr:MAG: hypothetical protein ACD_81C00218G0011 [uncultured bacterium]KKR12781.1 MAG: hypothetical protein UT41_C0001G0325 [Candidatus Wolfebacteria bacterium GW2011_GWC2_39_22]KKT43712.1 MAG: hypothetical protein UW32_C0001G0304 [Candidatus Wolfebacteria bacterium GW2011_GWE2_44_13]HBI25557.1 hypothetical protein [Candidatus Wolfebacteria bacterium]
MKDYSKDILQTLQNKQIEPLPRWVFLARQIAIISAFVLSVVIGGISVSVILSSLSEVADFGMGRIMRMHPGPFLFTYLPYIWVVVMGLFSISAYMEMRHTKGGYRYQSITIVGASILASLLLGVAFHTVGMGRFVDRRVSEAIPQYRGLDARKMHLWMQPQMGMLAGRIVSGNATTTFVLEDFSGTQWIVESADAVVRGSIEGTSGERIRAAGTIIRAGVFRATELFPWERNGMMQGGMRPVTDIEQRGMLLRERNMRGMPY